VLLQLALLASALARESDGGLPELDANTSLLVVSPHPDDESLCCAGAIQRVLSAGGRVSIVWITSGDASVLSLVIAKKSLLPSRSRARDLAQTRMQEARAATSVLGVPRTQQFFLGYPDGGVSRLLHDKPSMLHAAKFTRATHVPYPDAMFPGHPYTGESLERDFQTILEQVHPTLVLAPSLQDTHPDHHASGLLALQAIGRCGGCAKLRVWIVHDGEGWPSPRGLMPSIPLGPPTAIASARRRGAWVPFCLTEDEVTRKQKAIQAYHTQMQVMAPFLLSFVRTTEVYSAGP
jgi:LmbE family N-acetylglucosaminyl deacetylase